MEIEILPNRLYWICDNSPPRNKANAFYFSIDTFLVYQPFAEDFGPLNLAMTYKFCTELDRIMNDPKFASNRIYHYCQRQPGKKANAAYLMGAFQILVLKRSASEAWSTMSAGRPFVDFRDASQGPCRYKCTIAHCLAGLEKGVQLGWFNMKTFDWEFYEFHERVENGDFNWIIPGKMLAMCNPQGANNDIYGFRMWTPRDYVPCLKKLGVSAVVRLNNKTYDEREFTRNGINHYELFFTDGSVPPPHISDSFLELADREQALAIHCKAGLGRTGTLIGLYAMKNFGFDPAAFIGWCRICRPGSVLGPQQQYLVNAQVGSPQKALHPADQATAIYGDTGQANRLVNAKKSNQNTPIKTDSPKKPNVASPFKNRSLSNSPGSKPSPARKSDANQSNANRQTNIFASNARASSIGRQTHNYNNSNYR